LLGEQHDAATHQEMHRRAIEALGARGALAAVALEMAEQGRSTAGLRRDAARERLTAFVHDAVHTGLRCVRVVHGKGNGSPGREPVLKGKVRSWLIQKADVLAFVQARGDEGGHGAVIVLLRALR
jgi:hypothetical protein